MGWGGMGVKNVKTMTSLFWGGSKILNLLVFFIFSRKSVFGSRLHRVCVEQSGTGANAASTYFCYFCDGGVLGDFSDPMVPTLRESIGDVVTIYTSWDSKQRFLWPRALPRAGYGLFERQDLTVCTKNGLHFFILFPMLAVMGTFVTLWYPL